MGLYIGGYVVVCDSVVVCVVLLDGVHRVWYGVVLFSGGWWCSIEGRGLWGLCDGVLWWRVVCVSVVVYGGV